MKAIVYKYLFSWETHTMFCDKTQETHIEKRGAILKTRGNFVKI